MKFCPKCKKDLDDLAFSKRGRNSIALSSYCKKCTRQYCKKHYHANPLLYNKRRGVRQKLYRKELRELLNRVKNVPCMDCKSKFPSVCMDFDHVRGKKLCNLADTPSLGLRIDVVFAEIEKCDIVCSNCHRIRTHNRSNRSVAQPG